MKMEADSPPLHLWPILTPLTWKTNLCMKIMSSAELYMHRLDNKTIVLRILSHFFYFVIAVIAAGSVFAAVGHSLGQIKAFICRGPWFVNLAVLSDKWFEKRSDTYVCCLATIVMFPSHQRALVAEEKKKKGQLSVLHVLVLSFLPRLLVFPHVVKATSPPFYSSVLFH